VSYLLEALKRLEEKRQGDRVSDLLTVQGEIRRKAKKKVLWPYVLSAALLANVAVAVRWVGPWRAAGGPADDRAYVGPKEAATPTRSPVPFENERKAVEPAKPKVVTPLTEMVHEKGSIQTSETVTPAPRARKQPAPSLSPSEGSAEQPSSTAGASPQPQAPRGAKPRMDGKVLTIDELPVAVRSGLSELKVSLHSFSPEPRSRLVRINDRTLGEGDTLSQGVRVEEITPDGVIMSYQGYRFRVGVEQGR
jgi:general secretion pathway protein B